MCAEATQNLQRYQLDVRPELKPLFAKVHSPNLTFVAGIAEVFPSVVMQLLGIQSMQKHLQDRLLYQLVQRKSPVFCIVGQSFRANAVPNALPPQLVRSQVISQIPSNHKFRTESKHLSPILNARGYSSLTEQSTGKKKRLGRMHWLSGSAWERWTCVQNSRL